MRDDKSCRSGRMMNGNNSYENGERKNGRSISVATDDTSTSGANDFGMIRLAIPKNNRLQW
jgi:hypothetical protein